MYILKTCSIISSAYSSAEGMILMRKAFEHDVEDFLIIDLNTDCTKMISCVFDLLQERVYRVCGFLLDIV